MWGAVNVAAYLMELPAKGGGGLVIVFPFDHSPVTGCQTHAQCMFWLCEGCDVMNAWAVVGTL